MWVRILLTPPAVRRKLKGGKMTQNDLEFLQEALGVKCNSLLTEIVNNANIIQQIQEEQAKEQAKKSTKKESK